MTVDYNDLNQMTQQMSAILHTETSVEQMDACPGPWCTLTLRNTVFDCLLINVI